MEEDAPKLTKPEVKETAAASRESRERGETSRRDGLKGEDRRATMGANADQARSSEREPAYSERSFVADNGKAMTERTLTKTYSGAPENVRRDPEGKSLDAANRAAVRKESVSSRLSTDEMGHKHPAEWGAAVGETNAEAASDRRNLSPQSWVMNRGAGSPWRSMESDVAAYRKENPQSTITVSITERSVEGRGDRPISRSVSIVDETGATPPSLERWTGATNDRGKGDMVYMNPATKKREN